ncbi:MAG: hypothetical protein E7166_06325 [Firmicutes bacterium]|nr:hypothetical protein [Bacillota bacterium]
MAYQKRIPSIKLLVTKDEFNKLITIIDFINSSFDDYLEYPNKTSALKDKLLNYSVPRFSGNDNQEYVDVRFFPSEAGEIIRELIKVINVERINDTYFDILSENKKIKRNY